MDFVSRLLAQGRLRIPEELSLVLIDQNDASPPPEGLTLTTIELPLVEIGRRLAELTVQVKNGQELPREIILPARLIAGTSVSPLR
jgi:DNA-binding LacI/PurR family transcriptional regulator